MTRTEFNRHSWKIGDMVTLDNGEKRGVTTVNLISACVRIRNGQEGEWVTCDAIVAHTRCNGENVSNISESTDFVKSVQENKELKAKVAELEKALHDTRSIYEVTPRMMQRVKEAMNCLDNQSKSINNHCESLQRALVQFEKYRDILKEVHDASVEICGKGKTDDIDDDEEFLKKLENSGWKL